MKRQNILLVLKTDKGNQQCLKAAWFPVVRFLAKLQLFHHSYALANSHREHVPSCDRLVR
jgi:hypothetical protein